MICPCCGHSLLRHVRQRGLYWYCPSCRQEMPSLVCDRVSGHRDRSSNFKQYWVYLPLRPNQQKSA